MDARVAPRDAEWRRLAHAGQFPSEIVEPLKQGARKAGLWNMFLPSLRDDQPGARLTNLEYAPVAEVTGRIPWSPEVFNCNSPDSGNMEILQISASPAQRERWLNPLLEGSIRSCFSMTEPATACSDPTNLETTIVRDGDHYRVRGRKWFSTGAKHPLCGFSIVMGRSDLAGEKARANRGFYREGRQTISTPPFAPRQTFDVAKPLVALKRGIVFENAGTVLSDIGDGVLCFEHETKMNTYDESAFAAISAAVVETPKAFRALIFGNDHPGAFSCGAELAYCLGRMKAGDYAGIEAFPISG
jgi:Acyl-CoA dehydrogenase, N-terminal domain/Acyl-CoA dehydrogenase, middle domain